MKIFHGLFIVAIVVLLMSAGCTSSEKSTGNVLPELNTSSPNVSNLVESIPKDTITEKNMSSPIVGIWKIQTGDQHILYWRFHDSGKFTGGNEPGSNQITGNWSPFVFKNLFLINAVGTDTTGKQIKYDNVTIAINLDNVTASGVQPEYKSWKFTRQG
jgi:hypothetical protein